MLDSTHPLAELLRRDQRYHFDAYVFVFDALRYGQENMNLGRPLPSIDVKPIDVEAVDDDPFGEEEEEGEDRHVSGQELCEAIRRYALEQYGLLAKSVLKHWGITSTDDFGEIVFNLIDIGQMRKTEKDRREDFRNVYDFDEALVSGAVFNPQASSGESSK